MHIIILCLRRWSYDYDYDYYYDYYYVYDDDNMILLPLLLWLLLDRWW